jgi:hypothetical protein
VGIVNEAFRFKPWCGFFYCREMVAVWRQKEEIDTRIHISKKKESIIRGMDRWISFCRFGYFLVYDGLECEKC